MNSSLMKANLFRHKRFIYILLCILILFINFNALALHDPGSELAQAGITTNLGSVIDPGISLIDSSGTTKTVSELLADGKPLILIPAYYRCPRLCGLLLGGFVELVKDLDLNLGSDYKVATFSFNPREGPEFALEKRAHYSSVLRESGKSIEGWDFFVGDEIQTKALIKQLGFGVIADGEEYAHSAAIFILDKSGRISQFFTDIDFPLKDVRLALIDASQGKIGTILDRAVLFCFKFDPQKGKYTWAVGRLMQLVGALSILFVGGIIVLNLIKEKKRQS